MMPAAGGDEERGEGRHCGGGGGRGKSVGSVFFRPDHFLPRVPKSEHKMCWRLAADISYGVTACLQTSQPSPSHLNKMHC